VTTGGVRALFAKLEDEEPITWAAAAEILGLSPSASRKLISLLAATGDILRDEYDLIVTAEPSRRQASLPIGGDE
jgi:predicted ArsR family transcriptional regulator